MPGLVESSQHLARSPARVSDARSVGLALTKLDSFDAAQTLRGEWNQLAERVGGDIFATFEWCATWWKHFSAARTLMIFTARHDGELVAVVPLFRETIRWGPVSVRVVRALGTDHAGTRCHPLFEPTICDELAKVLPAALDREGPWDLLHIGDLPAYFARTRLLATGLRGKSNRHRVFMQSAYCPQALFDVPDDFEAYLSRLSGNERNNIRKAERRLSASATLRAEVIPGCEAAAVFLELRRLHDDYWRARGELSFFDKWPGAGAFHAEVAAAQADAGRLFLLRVRAGEDLIGYVYGHRFGRRLHLFQTVRAAGSKWESYSPGRLLHCAAMRAAIDGQLTLLDAMSGFYEYKRRLGARFPGLCSIAAADRRWSSRVRLSAFRAITGLIHLVYFRAWFAKLAPLLRKCLADNGPRFLGAAMFRRYVRSRFILDALSGRPMNDMDAVPLDD